MKKTRLCLQTCSVYTSLFNNNALEMLNQLTSLEIKADDPFTTKVCAECLLDMENACTIQQRIIENQKELESSINDLRNEDELIDYVHEEIEDISEGETKFDIPETEKSVIRMENCSNEEFLESENSHLGMETDCESTEKDDVETNKNKTPAKIYPTKRNYCVFCGSTNTKIARHFVTMHSSETKVQEFMKFPKGSLQRMKILETLRKNGNYLYNTKNTQDSNNLMVVRRPNGKNVNKQNFIPCPSCKGYYSINSLRHHYANCGRIEKGTRNILVQSRQIAKQIHPRANNVLRNFIFPTMREDDPCKLVRYDELAIELGNKLCDKFKSTHYHNMIRSKLRLIGRFKVALRNSGYPVKNFEDALHPSMIDHVIEAIHTVAGLDKLHGKYRAPATAFSLAVLLKECTKILINEYIKKQKVDKQKEASDFLKLLETDLKAMFVE